MNGERIVPALLLALPAWLAAHLARTTGAAEPWGALALGWACLLAMWRGAAILASDGRGRALAALAALMGAGALFAPVAAGLLIVTCALLALSLTAVTEGARIAGGKAEPALFGAFLPPMLWFALNGLSG